MKKGNIKIFLIGIAIILLAVLLILASIFVPRMRYKAEMKDKIELALSDGVTVMAVFDPLYENGELLVGDGKEVVLTDTERAAVRDGLSSLAEGGYRFLEKNSASGIVNICLTVRTESESVRLYFAADRFFYTTSEGAICFAPKNPESYAALRGILYVMLENE